MFAKALDDTDLYYARELALSAANAYVTRLKPNGAKAK